MKRNLIIALIFVFVTPLAIVYADSKQTYRDYLFQYDTYREVLADFKVARQEYEQFETLVSKDAAFESTVKLLSQRTTVTKLYLTLLREALLETDNIPQDQLALYFDEIHDQQLFYNTHLENINAVQNLEEAPAVSEEYVNHDLEMQITYKQITASISLGKVHSLQILYEQTLSDLEAFLDNHQQDLNPRKQAIADRWKLQISNKLELSKQAYNEAIEQNKLSEFKRVKQIQDNHVEVMELAKKALSEIKTGQSFINELMEELMYG